MNFSAQAWALSVIRDQPGIGMGELAKSLDVHQSTASNLVRNLQKIELIGRLKADESAGAIPLAQL